MLRGDEALASIQEFRELRRRDERDRRREFVIEGAQFVHAAARGRVRLRRAVVAPELITRQTVEAVRRLERSTDVIRVDARAFRRLSIVAEPSGVAAIAEQRFVGLERPRKRSRDLWVALGGLRTPGNVGTTLRTAAAAGARGVLLLDPATDPFDPTAVRASMGAVLRVPLCRVSSSHLRAWADRCGVTVVGGSASARRTHLELPSRGPLVVVLGSERKGLSGAQRRACHRLVRIPMEAGTSSLNVAVAAGVLLFTARCRGLVGSAARLP